MTNTFTKAQLHLMTNTKNAIFHQVSSLSPLFLAFSKYSLMDGSSFKNNAVKVELPQQGKNVHKRPRVAIVKQGEHQNKKPQICKKGMSPQWVILHIIASQEKLALQKKG